MDFSVILFIILVAVIVRSFISWLNKSSAPDRRSQLQELAQRMRAAKQRPGFPQPPGATYGRQAGGPGYQPPPNAQPGSTVAYQPPATAHPGSTVPYRPPTTARPGSTAAYEPPPIAQPMAPAPITPPSPPFTTRWPSGAPMDPPRSAPSDPVMVEVAAPGVPISAETTEADSAPDTTGDTIEDATAPTRRRGRYELSSSLDTTLSTSLSSSVIGEPASVLSSPQPLSPLSLPSAIEQQVLALMDQGFEVMAVRLVCDEMDVGILEAHRTVRSLAGLPTLM